MKQYLLDETTKFLYSNFTIRTQYAVTWQSIGKKYMHGIARTQPLTVLSIVYKIVGKMFIYGNTIGFHYLFSYHYDLNFGCCGFDRPC